MAEERTAAGVAARGAGPEAWRRNLYVVMVAVFASFTGFTFVMPFLPLYIRELGVTDPGEAALWSGFLFGVSPLLSGLLAPLWAILAERHGRKAMMQRALGVFVVVIVAMAFVTSVYQLLALRVLLGVFGGFGVMAVALASSLAPRERVGEAVGLLQATQLASGIGAPLLGGVVVDAVGIHRSFFAAAALCLAGLLLIRYGFREERTKPTGGAPGPARATLRQYLHLPVFVGLLVAIFTIQFIDRSFGPLLPLYIATLDAPADRVGSITGAVMTLGAIAGTVAAGYGGRLSARVAPRPLLLWSLAAGALCCLPIAFVERWWQLLVLRTLLGALAGGALTLAYAVGGRALPDGARLGAFGVLAGLGQIGGAVSPMVTGLLARWASLGAIFVLDAALYALVLAWSWRMLAPPSWPAAASPAARDQRGS
ncbi:MAG: Multidrug-efflux transporter, major facilitator superfamily (MFS) [uncultured Thermomicrobiales bacterium]|uniref:Multidrug-efflux transporter, major facilitator superfamily (MFS) n=1 Tax=uncultured Thermomicrobiales bacterium TaxID=1645740 RepID=A0A6J4VL12_9BACT|nr:MAG: Multidrug-efflux transporter, major facilitator superfamily (MFS) [uncultured Thermomicrobiales bacterium]